MKKIFFTLCLIAVSSLALYSIAAGQDFGLGRAANTSGLADNQISQMGSIPSVLGYVISIALALVGIFFFILILYAGIVWMTAGGASDRVESAKKKMVSAAIGLVIVLSAYALANFVFSNFVSQPAVLTGDDACKTAPDGSSCGMTQVCMKNKCKEECVYQFGQYYGGKCIDVASQSCNGIILSGKCLNNEGCCVPTDSYELWQSTEAASGGNTSAESSAETSESANTCEKQAGHFCTTLADCEGTQNGKSSG